VVFARVCGSFGEGPRGRARCCSPRWTGRTPHGACIRSSRRHDSMCCRPHAAIPRGVHGVLSVTRGDTTTHAAVSGRAGPREYDAVHRLRHVRIAHSFAPEHCRVASLDPALPPPSNTFGTFSHIHVPQSRHSNLNGKVLFERYEKKPNE
jgi:hypothetical protein